MKHLKIVASLLFVLTAISVEAQAVALRVVSTSAPAVNYIFSPSGTVFVTDMASPLFTTGFLQSRIYQAQPGSPAAGRWVYEYRVDMRNVVGILSIPYVRAVALNFGPVVSIFDYNFDGIFGDQVFVITAGGIGSIGLGSAVQVPGITQFNFGQYVYGGGSPGQGRSSYFFGLVSQYPPHVVSATVYTSSGPQIVSAYAPMHP